MDKAGKQVSDKNAVRRTKLRVMARACSLALAALSIGYGKFAAAEGFSLDNGDQGQWSAGASI
ncbi:MAG: hypothetical protein ACHP7O_03470, partial [Burkholderiales bacterium]